MIKKLQKNRGLVGQIILVVIAIIILGYFGFDLRRIIESEQVQENLAYFWNIIKIPFVWIWGYIDGLWYAFVGYLEHLLSGESDILNPYR